MAIEALELPTDSPSTKALLAALAERHGDAIARASRLLARLFLLRSPFARGLRFVGGEAAFGPLTPYIPAQRPLSLAGSGETIEDALASCIGEGVERLSQFERAGDVKIECNREDIALGAMPAAAGLIEAVLETSAGLQGSPAALVEGKCLATGETVLLPADWCLRRQSPGALAIPGATLSTGCAAGPDAQQAAARALLELVERDAASLWWIGGQKARPLAADSAAMAEAVRLFGVLRQGEGRRASWLLDITTDLNIPCFAAVSVEAHGFGFACGLGARLDPIQAARAAIFEMCQMELALPLVSAKQQQLGADALNEADRRHIARARDIDAARCDLIQPAGAPRRHSGPFRSAGEEQLTELRAAFAREGIEAVLVDMTRDEFKIPVVHACAPKLQLMPGNLRTERLHQVIEATGGGERWTGGVPLH